MAILTPDNHGAVQGTGQQLCFRHAIYRPYPMHCGDTIAMPVQRVQDAADVRAWLIYYNRVARAEANETIAGPIRAVRYAVARAGNITRGHVDASCDM